MAKAEAVATAAQLADYAPALAGRNIAANDLTTLLADIATARDTAAMAVAHTTERKAATVLEKTTAKTLLAVLRGVQKAAKQKICPH